MSLAREIERLAELRARGELSEEEFSAAKKRLLENSQQRGYPRCIRRQSTATLFGLPLWSIAMGPDAERGETRGHARGVLAVGDLATGLLAVGGWARGILAVGGLATGLFAFGGCAVGVILAAGGGAFGGIALGGLAAGGVAVGGLTCGWYSVGGLALGPHAVGPVAQDPEAVEFFRRLFTLVPGRR
jgi:hypothetical protein